MKLHTNTMGAIGCSLILVVVVAVFSIMGLMMDRNVEYYFGGDMHFLLDILCGCLLNGINLIAWVISLIMEYGADIPGPVFNK